jgi:hypothetical protein
MTEAMLDFLRRFGTKFAQPGVKSEEAPAATTEHPTIFHITHHKAGSQWIHRIFHALDYDRLVIPAGLNTQFFHRPIQAGKIYPTLYVTREQFESVALPPNSRWFVMIRDLRDTLVSAYFSYRNSHPVLGERHLVWRRNLSELSPEDGFLYLMDVWLPERVQVQWSWHASGEELIRYEDLLVRDVEILERVLIGRCGLPVAPERLREIVLANRFEKVTKGRSRGEEDPHAHERKGIGGDWKNHFTDAIKQEFKKRFGSILIATGYEKDFNW